MHALFLSCRPIFTLITGPPNRPVLFCSLASVVVVCNIAGFFLWRLSVYAISQKPLQLWITKLDTQKLIFHDEFRKLHIFWRQRSKVASHKKNTAVPAWIFALLWVPASSSYHNHYYFIMTHTPAVGLLPPAWVGRSVAYVCLSVCLFVPALTGKRLELSTPNLVHIYSIVVARHALT